MLNHVLRVYMLMEKQYTRSDVDVLLSAEQISKRTAELGGQISLDYADIEQPLIIVGILKGGYVFTADLARSIDISVEVDFLRVASYHGGTETTGEVTYILDLDRDIEGRDVLLVEDIVDTGTTMKSLLRHLGLRNPKSLKIASLLEKPEKNTAGIKVDYLGFAIENKFVVGYGLDVDEQLRELPFVGVMKNT